MKNNRVELETSKAGIARVRMMLTLAAGVFAIGASLGHPVDATKPGFKEVAGLEVSEGQTQTVTGDIIVGEGGEFRKYGKGTLIVPMSRVNRQLGWGLTASEGTTRLTVGEDATVPVGTIPTVFSKAAVWFNETSVVTTNGTGDAAYVSRWLDVRDVGASSVTHVYADPAWGSNSPNKSVPPVFTTKDDRSAMYFGGKTSGKHMNLSARIKGIYHQFVVHGSYDCFGALIGDSQSRVGMTLGSGGQTQSMPVNQHFVVRGDLNTNYASSRTSLNGEMIDPYTVGPKTGFQLLATDFLHRPGWFNKIFRSCFEVCASGDKDYGSYVQGGDYVSEIVVFTNQLSSGEILDVNRYLMRKWNLPQTTASTSAWKLLPESGTVGIASNAVVEVQAGEDEVTEPMAFKGDGVVRKTGAGTLVVGPDDGAASGIDLSLEGGAVLARGGRLPAVAVQAGDQYAAAILNAHGTGSRSAETDLASGAQLTKSTGSGEAVTKSGNDWLRVRSVASAVKELDVEAGVLELAAASRSGNSVAGPAVVAIPNGDFEAPVAFTEAAGCGKLSTGVTSWRSSNGYGHIIAYTNADAISWFGDSGRPRPLPSSGSQVLLLDRDNARAEIDVTFPQDGDYQLELNVATRYGLGKGSTSIGGFLQVMLGDALPGVQVGGDIFPSGYAFTRFRILLKNRQAKKQILRLQGRSNLNTSAFGILVDDVRIVYLGNQAESGVVEIPNGDFETVTESSSYPRHVTDYSSLNVADGWTFTCNNAECGTSTINNYIGLVNPGVSFTTALTLTDDEREQALLLGDLKSANTGCKSLLFLCTQTTAQRSFTVPAGRYYLRGRLARKPTYFVCNGKERSAQSAGKIHATVTMSDSSVVDLGSLDLSYTIMRNMTWPNVMTFASEQTVTLTLEQTEAGGSALVDDLVLVTEAKALEDAGLLKCGGAEDGYDT